MKTVITSVEILGMVFKEKESGKTLNEIIEIMRNRGFHEDTTKYYYSMLA